MGKITDKPLKLQKSVLLGIEELLKEKVDY
jgi:hypothetical protein